MLCQKGKQMRGMIFTRQRYVAQQARLMHAIPNKSNMTMLRREQGILKENKESFALHKKDCGLCK